MHIKAVNITFFLTQPNKGEYTVWYQVNNSPPICLHHRTVSEHAALSNIENPHWLVTDALIHYQSMNGWFQNPADPILPKL